VPLVSITRLQLISNWYLPQFFFHSLRSIAQLRRAHGYISGWTSRDAEKGYWTLTVWENAEAMLAFRNSGAHKKAMPKLLHMCNEASYTHFDQPGSDAPSAEAAYEILRRQGKSSKVNAPSTRQRAGERVGAARPQGVQRWSRR
jgi:hypothetical protein